MFTDTLTLLFAFFLGTCLGSFGTTLIPRLQRGESLRGRSRCSSCHHVLAPREIIPILSFMLQHGRCRHCAARIPVSAPLLEFLCGTTVVLSFLLLPLSPLSFVLTVTALLLLIFIAVADAQSMLIPDLLTLLLFLTSLLVASTAGDLRNSLLGAGVLFVFFSVQVVLGRGRWLGSGDVLLGTGVGLLLGLPHSLLALGMAYIVGAGLALSLLALHRAHRGTRLPFAPFLAAGTFLSALSGEYLLQALL